jgi:hypothetical protein
MAAIISAIDDQIGMYFDRHAATTAAWSCIQAD